MIQLPGFNLQSGLRNDFDIARFNLIWRVNYILTILFFLLSCTYIPDDLESFTAFFGSFFITGGCLLYLYKTRRYKPIYFVVSFLGLILPQVTMHTMDHIIHYGDIIWLVVAVTFAFFGLGIRIGFLALLITVIGISCHILFTLNENINHIGSLSKIAQLSLIVEISIALFITFYTIYQYTSLHTKSEQKLTAANKALEQSNSEKEVLLKEIHHRVKNNLQVISSLLNLQSSTIEDASAISAVREGQSRIKTMALLHQKLYQNENLSQVDFEEYAKELIHQLYSSFGKSEASKKCTIDINNVHLDIDTAVPLALILNELVSNAIKYAIVHSPQLYISISQSSEKRKLIVKDSGQGLPNGFDFETSETLGLRLVKILSTQLRGEVAYTFDKGATFEVAFQETALRKQIA